MNDGVHKVNMRLCKKSKGMRILSLVAGCLLIFSAGSILRAQDQKPRIDEFKKKAQDISREIEKGKAKIQKFSHRETDIISRLNQVDQALNRSRIRIAGLSREIERLEKKITETAAASEKLVDQIKANETYIAKRLVALYKLSAGPAASLSRLESGIRQTINLDQRTLHRSSYKNTKNQEN